MTAPATERRSGPGFGAAVRRVLSGLAVSLTTLIVLALLLEVALRVLKIGSDATTREHPVIGWVHLSSRHVAFESEDHALGRQIEVEFNALGLRDVERRVDKSPGTYRVLMMGDSYVEAMQVPLDSSLTRRLERTLEGRDGRRVEVWNCGVAGYTTSNELLYLREQAARWHPDLVVLCFLSGNDIADQVPALATSLRNRPFFRRDSSGWAIDRSRFKTDAGFVAWLRTNSRLLPWVKRQASLMRRNAAEKAAAPGGGSPTLPIDLEIYSQHPDSAWAAAWDLTEQLLLEVRDESERIGAGFLLVSISNGVQESAVARRNRPNWVGWIDRPEIAMDWPETRLTRFAAAHAIDYLPLLPAFRSEVERAGRPLHIEWVGHWNGAGHEVAARAIAARISARLDAAAALDSAAAPRVRAPEGRSPAAGAGSGSITR